MCHVARDNMTILYSIFKKLIREQLSTHQFSNKIIVYQPTQVAVITLLDLENPYSI